VAQVNHVVRAVTVNHVAARRVLVLNHFAAPPSEPGGTRHVEMFSRLHGWESTIIAANRNLITQQKVSSHGGRYRTVWTTPVSRGSVSRIINWISFAVSAFFRGLRSGKVDVVYGSSPHLLAPLSAYALARVKRARFVLEVRDLWPQILSEMGGMSKASLVYRILERLESFLYRKADAIVVMALGVERELAQRGHGAKLHYIPNSADPDDMSAPAPREQLRQRFGFSTLTGVYAGAHGPANGLDLLIDAVADGGIGPERMRIVLVGDGAEKPKLRQLVAQRGLPNDVVTFLDPIAKSEIPALLGAADFGVHILADVELFRTGVSPNKLFDYMAAGLPSLTNTGGDTGALVADNNAGVAVAANDLVAGLRTMVEASAEQRAAWGASGRRYMQEHQSRTAMAGRLEALLEQVAARAHR